MKLKDQDAVYPLFAGHYNYTNPVLTISDMITRK